jgi:hypothetical protein
MASGDIYPFLDIFSSPSSSLLSPKVSWTILGMIVLCRY